VDGINKEKRERFFRRHGFDAIARPLSASIRNYCDVFSLIFFHRRGAKGAEKVKLKIIHLQRGPIIGRASVDFTLPYL
jgi:hypothetical protein